MLVTPTGAAGPPSPLRGGWRVAVKPCLHSHAPGEDAHDTPTLLSTPTPVPLPQGGGERCGTPSAS
jgi:hypothetical protein